MIQQSEDYSKFEIGGYKIIKQLGKGQFGKVYLAKDKNDIEVAIKTIKKADLKKSQKRQKLFETERAIMRRVKNQNVVKLYESLETDDYHLLVMEYCNNGDLYYYIKNHLSGFMSQEQGIESLMQILNGFKGLHQHMVLHRDIKLKNIMVHNSTLKIADFGLSKFGQLATTVVGTPYTKAPEVFKKKTYDSRADIWSLGIIFYQMLFKLQYPFTAKTEDQLFNKIIGGQKPNFQSGGVKISEQVQDLLSRMLTTDPNKRINWKDITQHPAIANHESKAPTISSFRITSSQYYQKIEQHLSRYQSLRASISNYFACLSRLICLLPVQPEFRKINILYFQFLLCKQMKWNMKTLKEALKACMDLSQVDELIGKQELDDCENEVENYYSESLINLQLYLADRSKSNPDIEKQMGTYNPDPAIFKRFSCRLCQILEGKLDMFKEAPNIQKNIAETVEKILMLFILDPDEGEFPSDLNGMKTYLRNLRKKISGQ